MGFNKAGYEAGDAETYLHKAKALEIEEEAVIVGWLTQYSFKPFLP